MYDLSISCIYRKGLVISSSGLKYTAHHLAVLMDAEMQHLLHLVSLQVATVKYTRELSLSMTGFLSSNLRMRSHLRLRVDILFSAVQRIVKTVEFSEHRI